MSTGNPQHPTATDKLTAEPLARELPHTAMPLLSHPGLTRSLNDKTQLQYTFTHSNALPMAIAGSTIVGALVIHQTVMKEFRLREQLALAFVTLVLINSLKLNYRETATVTKGVGLEVSATYGLPIPQTSHRFIPSSKIKDVVILEAFYGLQVVFRLTCIVDGDSTTTLILPNSGLSLDDWKMIRQDIRQMLF